MSCAADQMLVSDAWRVLFGRARAPSEWDGARWEVELRRAYRRRAFDTHPDRAAALGCSAAALGEEFRRVTEAFALLSTVGAPSVEERRAPVGKPAPAQSEVQSFYRGPLPSRRLRISEYLYYSGRVCWRDHVGALAWQRRNRPTIGELARTWRYLSSEQLSELLRRHPVEAPREPLGQFALRCGLLTHFQLLAVLGKQRSYGFPIGRYFLENGLCAQEEIGAAVDWQRSRGCQI